VEVNDFKNNKSSCDGGVELLKRGG